MAPVALSASLLGACGDSGRDGDSAATGSRASTSATAGATTTTSTTAPATFEAGLMARWSDELGDPILAAELVDQLGPEALTQLEQQVGRADVMTSPFVSFSPPTIPDLDVDSLVVYAFGNREAAGGALTPGPTNEALAQLTADFLAAHPVPVFAQWEVADLLAAQGVTGVTSIDPDSGPGGEMVYLSTAGVADKAVALADAAGVDLGQVGVIAFQDHAARCVLVSEDAGMAAAVPEGVELPSAYDRQSGQEWTRGRLTYLATDLQGRLLTAG